MVVRKVYFSIRAYLINNAESISQNRATSLTRLLLTHFCALKLQSVCNSIFMMHIKRKCGGYFADVTVLIHLNFPYRYWLGNTSKNWWVCVAIHAKWSNGKCSFGHANDFTHSASLNRAFIASDKTKQNKSKDSLAQWCLCCTKHYLMWWNLIALRRKARRYFQKSRAKSDSSQRRNFEKRKFQRNHAASVQMYEWMAHIYVHIGM